MPEVIEVQLYADFLRSHFRHHQLLGISILKGRYHTHGPFEHYHSLQRLLPLQVLDVQSKGKFMYLHLQHDLYLGFTLGLTGAWLYQSNAQHKNDRFTFALSRDTFTLEDALQDNYLQRLLNHLNVAFLFDNGYAYFCDQLSFGTIKVFQSTDAIERKIGSVGHSVLGDDFTLDHFRDILERPTIQAKAIGIVLMNQKVIGGIGNYLRSDVLWHAKISPYRKVRDLSASDIKRLYHSILLLVWGSYDRTQAIRRGWISKKDKLPEDYDRDFFVYQESEDIYGHRVRKEPLYEGSQKRFIYWVPERQE